jgi:pimeloyl-ACP methyl ester carboxylesterase
MPSLLIRGGAVDYTWIPGAADGRPTLVLLHEGLGSVSMWRDFPQQLALASGCPTLVYSRHGYGQSQIVTEPRGVEYMHDEALDVLPELLDSLGIDNPVLVGHSDGASIALIYAGGSHRPVRGLILEAPHVFVEDLTVESIAAAKRLYAETDLAAKLGRHHADPDATFRGWNDIWLHPGFRDWNIESYLPKIFSPVLVIQGADDQYGTLAQVDAIGRGVSGPFDRLVLENCRHSPHRDQAEATLAAMTEFVARLPR